MSYTPTNWVNGQTPINEENLNKIEQGIEELDSKLSGNFIYELRQSTVSFMDADNTTSAVNYAGCLDVELHPNIGNYSSNINTFVITNGGPVWFVLLGKQSNTYYAGQIWSYSNSAGPIFFIYKNGTFIIYKPKAI